jgi:WD40 repeat protein
MEPPNPSLCPTGPAKVVAKLAGHPGGVLVMVFSPDRGRLVSAGRDGAARLWDMGNNPPIERAALGPGGRRLSSLAFAPTGRAVAAGSGALDGLIWLYDVSGSNPLEVATLRGPRGAVTAVSYSLDSTHVAAAGEDRILRLWDASPIPRADARVQLPGHTGAVRALVYAPDGQSIATASDDATVRLWSVAKMRASERLMLPHPTGVTAVAYTRDGQVLLTGGRDGVIRFWDATASVPTPRAELPALRSAIRQLLITKDGQTLVSATDGPQVVHWDLSRRTPIREWTLPTSSPTGVAVTVDGRYLAGGRADGQIEICRLGEKRG